MLGGIKGAFHARASVIGAVSQDALELPAPTCVQWLGRLMADAPSPETITNQSTKANARRSVSGTSVGHALTSRGAMRPEFESLSARRGRGECRVPSAPAAPCALGSEVCARVFTAEAPESPGIPARNGFNGFLRALPGDEFLLPPSLAD